MSDTPEFDVQVKKVPRLGPGERRDGWSNVLTGLGGSLDKRKKTTYSVGTVFTHEELSDFYADGLVRRIVDTEPDDMTREWLHFVPAKGKSRKDADALETSLAKLNVQASVNLARKWSRLFGGSLLFIGAKDGGSLDSPLRIDRVRSISYLRVFDLGEIITSQCVFDEDPFSSTFGEILLYKINAKVGATRKELYIHSSRCIPFYGPRMPPSALSVSSSLEVRTWGLSIIQIVWDYLSDFTSALGSVGVILQEFIIGKYRLADLDEMLSQGNESLLQTRIQAIDMTKSVIHAVLLGTDEEYSRDSASLSGIPDTLDRFMMILSAVTEIPVTKLFGRSAAGLNATGENDLRNYYDVIRSKQQNELTVSVKRIVDIVRKVEKITSEPRLIWNPLMQMTEKDEMEKDRIDAERYRTQANGDLVYLQEGVLLPEDVYTLRFEAELGKRDFDAEMPVAPLVNAQESQKQLQENLAKQQEGENENGEPTQSAPGTSVPEKKENEK